MSIIVEPFTADHLPTAAELLAVRHHHDRQWAPSLSVAYEDPAETLSVVEALLATNGTSGVVELHDGRLVGYLIGAPELLPPTSAFAGFLRPRGADIPYGAYAADPDIEATVYPRLYGRLAQQWVATGLTGHFVTVPVRPITLEIWANLGFGRYIALAARSTASAIEWNRGAGLDIEVRRATPDDEPEIQDLMNELFRSFADPPIFVPFLPETEPERRRLVSEHLLDPSCPAWLAVADGRVVSMQIYEEPHSSQWHQSPLTSPPGAVYLYFACTAPEMRGSGVGVALFTHAMAWAREAGYAACTAHFLTASRASAFWLGLGFRTLSYALCRAIDERATWARGAM